ncbi:hypothetical protein A4G19_10620 [Pasteurellaceae bacterium Macca]|nr:hypothetical protein [Pasteurellaceae bacterium Macca]
MQTKGGSETLLPTKGGNQELTFINEPNLYRLIIKSRKPEAEPFEAWVFEEVLPQIRKTGQYSQNLPENRPLAIPELTFTVEMSEDNRNVLLSNWFALHNTLKLLAS